jgi:hypothetical protein
MRRFYGLGFMPRSALQMFTAVATEDIGLDYNAA